MDKFLKELHAAEKRGVDVRKVIEEDNASISRKADAEVQRFGLRCAIVFSFFTPLFLYSLIYISALQHLDLKLSPDHALIVCLGNMASIIAFGFRGPSGVKK